MSDWYYRAINEIEREYEDGLLTDKEFRQAMRDLNAEYDEAIEKERDERFY